MVELEDIFMVSALETAHLNLWEGPKTYLGYQWCTDQPIS